MASALAIVAVPASLLAQEAEGATGRVQGRVVNAEDGSAVSSASVQLQGTEIGTITDLNGRYQLRDVPVGSYDLVVSSLGFARKTVTGVTVEAGEIVRVDVTIEPEAVRVSGITVSVDQEKGTAAALLNEQKRALTVSDAVGEEQISGLPASDAAESARQIAGVTVSQGKFVFVRGLGKRYSQTFLNGSPLPSPEPEKSVVPLDLFPAGFLESLTVQKTYTPDQPADFSGGSVDIETKEYPDRFSFSATLGSSLNAQSHLSDGYLSYDGGGTDFLGFDDGTRDLPSLIQDELGGLGGQQMPADPAARERFGEAFATDGLDQFSPSSGGTPPNLDLGFSMGDRVELFGKDFGYIVSGTYSSDFHLRDDEVEREWEAEAFDPDVVESVEASGRELTPDVSLAQVRATHSVDWGAMGNFTMSLGPEHEISLKTLYNRNADDEARRFRGDNREDFGAELVNERLRFVSRSMGWGQLSGQHRLGATTIEWKATAARATRDEPGLRETVSARPFSAEASDPFFVSDEGSTPRYLFDSLTDDDLNGGVDWTVPFGFVGDAGAEFKVGAFARTRSRDFRARRFQWRIRGDFQSLEEALTPENIVGSLTGPGQVTLREVFQPGDDYTTDDETLAGYGMVTLPLGPVELVGGARVEEYDLVLDVEAGGTAAGDPFDSRLSSTDVLPAVNAKVAVTDAMNVRAAFSETLDRPEFRELAPFLFTEATSLRSVEGNPDLQIADVRNWDLRWEWFPSPGETVSVSGFHKDLTRPIEQVFISAAAITYSYQNADDGELYGAEFSFRKKLGFLTPALEGFTLGGNLTLVDSEVQVSEEGVFDPTNQVREPEGQSNYSVNASLSYRDPGGGTEADVSFHVFGERITAAGGGGIPDIEEQPRPVLDLSFEQPLWRNMELELKAENLLDSAHEWTQSANGITRVQRRYHVGQSFSASLTIRR